MDRETGSYPFLQGGGELGSLIRGFDWSQTPVGSPGDWPQSLRTMAALVLRSPSPMCLYWGRNSQTFFYNDAFHTMLCPGGRHHLLGEADPLVWPDHLKFEGPHMRTLFDGGEPVQLFDKLVMVHKNGRQQDTYWTFSYNPVLGESGAVAGVLATCVETAPPSYANTNFVYQAYKEPDGRMPGIMVVANEVTEQIKAVQRIELSEERARLAIHSAELGVYEANLTTNKIDADARFHEMFGTNPAGSWDDAVRSLHPDDRHIREQAIQTALKTGQLTYQARVIKRDGSTQWVRVLGRMLYGKEGEAVKLIGVVQDIAEQKRSAEELETKVTERTKELAQANKQLQQSNDELNQFAYIASHDLQEPLRKVRTYSGLLATASPGMSAKGKDYLQRIDHSTQTMQNLIHDVLSFSRIMQQTERFEKVDLYERLLKVQEDCKSLIEQTGAGISVAPLPVLEANGLQISQLFTNLISNALKFRSPKRKPQIQISFRQLSGEEASRHMELFQDVAYHLIECKDNGIGFDEQYAERIFVIFQRLHGKGDFEGTGIGLAMCKKIVLNHHGLIYATAETDKGAHFSIILPETQNSIHRWQKQDLY